jgi:hypothetical protein
MPQKKASIQWTSATKLRLSLAVMVAFCAEDTRPGQHHHVKGQTMTKHRNVKGQTMTKHRTWAPALALAALSLTALAGASASPSVPDLAPAVARSAVALVVTGAIAQADLKIGGFDLSRGGRYSIASGVEVSNLRNAILTAYPQAQLSGTSDLTEEYLSGIDVLVISCLKCLGPSCDIRPVSGAEQSAMLGFVEAGGTALLFSENFDFIPANQSILEAFEIRIANARVGGVNFPTVPDPESHDVTNGPFGRVSSFRTAWPGWFEDLGSHGISLATLNGHDVLAVIDPGMLAPSSGLVVAFSDSSMIGNDDLTNANSSLVLNTIAARLALGCIRDPAWQCDGDVDGDGQVNPVDSGLIQAAFGSTDGGDLCQYDMDCDGQINPVDSGIVQSLFGTCEPVRDVCR